MAFNKTTFYADFRDHLDNSKAKVIQGKTPNQVDTHRIFEAADKACKNQRRSSPETDQSFWNKGAKGEPDSKREFLCDYTYHDEYGRILLALECEWGKQLSPDTTIEMVLYDFKKVLNMAAPIKVMVFAYTSPDNKRKCLDKMKKTAEHWPPESLTNMIAVACNWYDEMHGNSIDGYFWNGSGWENFK
ncbi:hypothetical protein ABMA57_14625 [Saccharospirillum sp. HFRX-1]|uniref:hypothetical protein n=1 Tax=unclassified Saccharospirillum TaxID=2633430 RepID=UPI003721FED5